MCLHSEMAHWGTLIRLSEVTWDWWCRWVRSSKCCHSAVSHTAFKQALQSGDPNMATHLAFRKSGSTAVCKDYPIKHVKGFHMKFFSGTLDIWEPACGRRSVSVIFGWGILGRPSFLILSSPQVCPGWPLFWITYGFLLSHPPRPNCVYIFTVCGWLMKSEITLCSCPPLPETLISSITSPGQRSDSWGQWTTTIPWNLA